MHACVCRTSWSCRSASTADVSEATAASTSPFSSATVSPPACGSSAARRPRAAPAGDAQGRDTAIVGYFCTGAGLGAGAGPGRGRPNPALSDGRRHQRQRRQQWRRWHVTPWPSHRVAAPAPVAPTPSRPPRPRSRAWPDSSPAAAALLLLLLLAAFLDAVISLQNGPSTGRAAAGSCAAGPLARAASVPPRCRALTHGLRDAADRPWPAGRRAAAGRAPALVPVLVSAAMRPVPKFKAAGAVPSARVEPLRAFGQSPLLSGKCSSGHHTPHKDRAADVPQRVNDCAQARGARGVADYARESSPARSVRLLARQCGGTIRSSHGTTAEKAAEPRQLSGALRRPDILPSRAGAGRLPPHRYAAERVVGARTVAAHDRGRRLRGDRYGSAILHWLRTRPSFSLLRYRTATSPSVFASTRRAAAVAGTRRAWLGRLARLQFLAAGRRLRRAARCISALLTSPACLRARARTSANPFVLSLCLGHGRPRSALQRARAVAHTVASSFREQRRAVKRGAGAACQSHRRGSGGGGGGGGGGRRRFAAAPQHRRP
eukprot:351398-Chlamydomonas_euryale.AAC.4